MMTGIFQVGIQENKCQSKIMCPFQTFLSKQPWAPYVPILAFWLVKYLNYLPFVLKKTNKRPNFSDYACEFIVWLYMYHISEFLFIVH